ncbi:MAG: hypothetical protein LBR41_01855 [Rickettsiales bacterium]|jgi:hypothetical protein|nr:hypothetical protein [Rickettsiales bacterium]
MEQKSTRIVVQMNNGVTYTGIATPKQLEHVQLVAENMSLEKTCIRVMRYGFMNSRVAPDYAYTWDKDHEKSFVIDVSRQEYCFSHQDAQGLRRTGEPPVDMSAYCRHLIESGKCKKFPLLSDIRLILSLEHSREKGKGL